VIKRILAAGAAAAVASVIFSATPASAASTFCVQTTDAGKSAGEACWMPNGDKLEACDLEDDGLRVRVEMTYAGGSISFQVYNGKGTCRSVVKALPAGRAVTVKVCLKSGDAGREVYCASESGFA
jgi:hypothetical protein